MSEVMDNLVLGRSLAWDKLRPAFDHAIALAIEAEQSAASAENRSLRPAKPAYPVLVWLLAESVSTEDEDAGE